MLGPLVVGSMAEHVGFDFGIGKERIKAEGQTPTKLPVASFNLVLEFPHLQIAYSPLGQTIASCSLDGSVNIWDVTGGTRGRLDGRLDFHCGKAWCCEFSPDGRWLLTGGANGSDGCVLGHDTRILKTPWAIMGFDSPGLSSSICHFDDRSTSNLF